MADARGRLEHFARRARDLPFLSKLDIAAVEVFQAFETAGVNAVLLKGPALARTLYRVDEHRGYSDVDLLVAPGDLPRARRAILDLGYANIREGLGIDDVADALDAEAWAGIGDGARAGVMIDLHWRLPGSQAEPQVAWDALSKRRTTIDLRGRRVPVLTTEGLAMQVATHAAQHGSRYQKPIEDLTIGLERWPPEVWRGAERLARETQASEAFAAGLRLVPSGAALASELGLPATDGLQWTITQRHTRPRGTFHLQAFAEAGTLLGRASVLRRALLPRREWIAWQYPWSHAGGVRLVVAYGLHLMRAPLWAGRAWWFRHRARRAGGR